LDGDNRLFCFTSVSRVPANTHDQVFLLHLEI
jgi:hypothetical protein